MTIQQEAELQVVTEANKRDREHIFNRPLYQNNDSYSQYKLNLREMRIDPGSNDIIF
jgi:hypothetical protein